MRLPLLHFLLLLAISCTGRAQNSPAETWNVVNGPTIPGVEHGSFVSAAVHAIVGYNVWVPAAYSASKEGLPVVYFLHGSGGTEYSAVGTMVSRLREAIEQKLLPPLLCVFPNGDHSGYRDDETTGIMGESEIVKELVPCIDAKYHPLTNRRVVMGFSMGASGAIRFAVKHPDLFAAAVGWAGGYRGTADSARENIETIKRLHTGLMIVIGDKDNVKLNEEFTGELSAMEIPYTYKVLPGVSHDFAAHLSQTWPEAVSFIAAYLR